MNHHHYSTEEPKKSVFITGWQVNWAVRLTDTTRLIDALKSAAKNGAKLYVMPWLSPKVGVNTSDFGTMLAVFQLNAGHDDLVAFCCPAGLQNDNRGIEETFFSHHQKLVVIDNSIAYVGGIDLAFGRRDDASFSLEHGWRTGPEVYNTGVPPLDLVAPGAASAYVEEGELLNTTLTSGKLNDILQAQNRATTLLMSGKWSPMKAVDGLHHWWHSEPPEWFSNAKGWVGDAISSATSPMTEPISRKIDEKKQSVADRTIKEMRAGHITESNASALIGIAREIARIAYVGLLETSWKSRKANAEASRPGTQSAPTGGRLYRPYQPRMPWQDVQVRIEGPSVYDLSMNFIRRWNSLQASYLPADQAAKSRIGAALMPQEPAAGEGNGGTGGVKVDVLRSAPLTLQRDEKRAMPKLREPVAAQREIHDAMVAAIRGAERFIYIENQFFQSGFGKASIDPNDTEAMSGPMRFLQAVPGNRIQAAVTNLAAANANRGPRNHIARAIADRIEHAIRWNEPFHAYMILPCHPEGSLADMAIVGQIHWTMQSLVYASDSLVNRIRQAIYAKKNCKNPASNEAWNAAKALSYELVELRPKVMISGFEKTTSISDVAPYLTLLNLRSCQTVAGSVQTEQAYVHSKLLIVDDRIVIVGSANINDRSLAGGRDSELAVCLTDLSKTTAPLDGKNAVAVRPFAHNLRMDLWKKHFGLSGKTDIIKPASQLQAMLDKPAAPATWQAIQAIAQANAASYAAAFEWVPKPALNDGASSIWPVWTRSERFSASAKPYDVTQRVAPFASRMPFSEDFWRRPKQITAPKGILGYICALPLHWTFDENNHPGMNMILLTQTDPPRAGSNATQVADNTKTTTTGSLG